MPETAKEPSVMNRDFSASSHLSNAAPARAKPPRAKVRIAWWSRH
jgi:hypothetical protein